MDPRTVALVLLISGLECSLLFIASGSMRLGGRPANPALFWGVGTATHAAGVTLLMLQGAAHPLLSVVLPNVLLVAGQLLVLAGIRVVMGLGLPLFRYALGVAAYAGLTLALTFAVDSVQVRIAAFSLVLALCYGEATALVLSGKRDKPGALNAFLAFVFSLMALFFLVRAAFSLFAPPEGIFTPEFINLLTYLMSHVALIGWTLGLILLRQQHTERELKRAVDEKALLLSELQHRIKNSLAVVASLVKLEGSRSDHPGTVELFSNLHDRVAALAVLYEHLSESGQSDRVDMAIYLRSLMDALAEGQAAGARGIELRLELEPIILDMKRAVPLGIIVNELVSDCLKHAFFDGRGGLVSARLSVEGETVRLSVRDNGKGLPPAGAQKPGGMGLMLVNLLAQQIGGSFVARTDGGALFALSFPLVPKA